MTQRDAVGSDRPDGAPPSLESLLSLAEQFRLRGDYQRGVEIARQAVELTEAAGGAPRALALRCLASQLLRIGEYEQTVAACRDAIAIMAVTGDDEGVCAELTAQAMALIELGLFNEALEGLSEARDVALRLNDPDLLYWVHNRTGVVHSSMGDHEQGRTHLLRALALAGDMDTEARFCILNNLADNAVGLVLDLRSRGMVSEAEAALSEARDHAVQALDLARAANHPFRTAICLDNYGMLLGLAGQYPAAFAAIGECLDLALANGYRSLECSGLQHSARLYRLKGEYQRAIDGMRKALGRAEESGDRLIAIAAHQELCAAYEQTEDFRAALDHYRRFHALEREARSDVAAARARLMTHHFELDNARLETEKARLEAELQRVRSRELEEDKRALQLQALELDRYAHEDALTGLANRRWVDLRLPEMVATAARSGRLLSIAIADVDQFKGVNDRFGHLVGDEVLKQIATLLRAGVNGTNLVARLGGEEFLLAFNDATQEQAYRACELLRTQIACFSWDRIRPGLRVTISFGLAERRDGPDHHALLAHADAGLYRAKHNGRNRVEIG